MANFDTTHDLFSQLSYEETVNAQADILIALEVMRHTLQNVMLDMANLETEIYGNSRDSFDNVSEVNGNTDNVLGNKHTLSGLFNRVYSMQDSCQ